MTRFLKCFSDLRVQHRLPMVVLCGLVVAPSLRGAPPLIVETDPLPPEEQRLQFELPPGFVIELIASEPDIGQPMNLNFDAAGRLWVTHSVEYPYPVAGDGVEERPERFGPLGAGPARDHVSIISGIGTGDIQVAHFADGLNIPIGIVPISTTSAIGYSIPDLVRWDAGERVEHAGSVLYGPFGNIDTHGMVNGLTYWIDGWVYACHGFANTSTVKGSDGHEITMNSGNTFRFRPDGSHVEQFTWGQVNPFGLTFDSWGNIYTADCHSKPLTCLIPGAYYSSFGKPHDGLGFGPDMIDHSHGSTGICGPCYYAADQFPEDYRECLYLCNPVTGRVHRDKLIWHGSTPHVDTQPDFITCKDGWFRPVDIQLGPDGALYIADFYNAIIGHYEVPLDNPKRDRTHGRVWQVTYTDTQSGERQSADGIERRRMPELTQESLDELLERLGDPNLTVRLLAHHLIADQKVGGTAERLRRLLDGDGPDVQRAHALWLLHEMEEPGTVDWPALVEDKSPLVRTHVARVLGSRGQWMPDDTVAAAMLLSDDDARVQRAAAEACSLHPSEAFIDPLLENLPPVTSQDTHLRHAMRIALRNCLQLTGELAKRTTSGSIDPEIASVCLGIPSATSAAYLLKALHQASKPLAAVEWTAHVARYGNDDDVKGLVSLLREQTGDKVTGQLTALRAIEAGQSLRGSPRPSDLIGWATDLARRLLDEVPEQPETWTAQSLPYQQRPPVIWATEVRTAVDRQPTRLWSSLPGGEQGVGVLRSPSFELPAEIRFWIAGHDGLPNTDAAGENLVQLVRDGDGLVLQSVPVPRQDPPVPVTWPFSEGVGEPVHFELVDGLDLDAYAWTAAGRFSVTDLNPVESLPSELAAELIGSMQLEGLRPEIERLMADAETPTTAVRHLAEAHLKLQPDVRLQAMLPWLDAASQAPLSAQVRQQIIERDSVQIDELLKLAMRTASSGGQQAMAETLAGSRDGGRQLVELVAAGLASPRLLTSATVAQKLLAVADEPLKELALELVKNLPPANAELTALIHERRTGFHPAAASAERGRDVFKKSCAACHQIGEEGKKIGPQLDGVGIRGIDRLLEDTLDPNRNVDAAFRTTTILTGDGRVLTGLLRREEGETLVLADSRGEEFRVAMTDVDERSLSPLSLMPEDIAVKLPAGDLHDLLAFLLAQTNPVEQ